MFGGIIAQQPASGEAGGACVRAGGLLAQRSLSFARQAELQDCRAAVDAGSRWAKGFVIWCHAGRGLDF